MESKLIKIRHFYKHILNAVIDDYTSYLKGYSIMSFNYGSCFVFPVERPLTMF